METDEAGTGEVTPDPLGSAGHSPSPQPSSHRIPVVALHGERARDTALVGAKAAALAKLHALGLPVLPGAVLTTEVAALHDAGTPIEDLPGVDEAIAIAGGPDAMLVVRSSSVAEDTAESSAAGQFESIIGVAGAEAVRSAVSAVLHSRERAGAADQPIAVLVQPMVEPSIAGVFFGVDPVSGRSDRRVVSAVRGQPEQLVSGDVEGSRWLLDERASVLEAHLRDGAEVPRGVLRRLVALGDRLSEEFGGPQDVEWALVGDRLVVLQSRPVTSLVRGRPEGPVYGPGPVAETFPEPLEPLEQDLWVPPLREGVRAALGLSGAVPRRELERRDLVVVVDGTVAIDLEVTGPARLPGSSRLGARIRRLRSAWRVGRLRHALPIIADGVCARADADLESVPELSELSSRQLLALIGRARERLRSLHAHEILIGLVSEPSSTFTGASVALRVLAESRRAGRSDDEIVRHSPVVLALVPPRIGEVIELPAAASADALAYEPPEAPDVQVRREALRLRIRWLQELVGRAAHELAVRLAEQGALLDADDVRQLRFERLISTVGGRRPVAGTAREPDRAAAAGPVPARFRLSDRGLPIRADDDGSGDGGTGAGGGVGAGVVTHDRRDPPEGSVLVVGALSPSLAPLLPRLTGIVSETGSVLSHLAILARESGVPVVVGHPDAVAQFPEGSRVLVDGQSGCVVPEEAP